MTILLSSKCQVVIPQRMRRRVGLQAGQRVEMIIRDGGIFLKPVPSPQGHRYKIKINKKTGLPYAVTPGLPTITSKDVEAALEDFP